LSWSILSARIVVQTRFPSTHQGTERRHLVICFQQLTWMIRLAGYVVSQRPLTQIDPEPKTTTDGVMSAFWDEESQDHFCSRMVDAARTPDGVSPKYRRNMRLK
jgi:hypothetical protein